MTAFPLPTQPIRTHNDYCLNSRHTGAACTRCVTACPCQAIAQVPGGVSVAGDACLGCGLCLHECPAQVFETSRWRERTPLMNARELQSAGVDLFCTRHPAPESGRREADSLQIPTCLAALSPGFWFELGLSHTVYACLDACAGCPLAAVVPAVEAAVETANGWLHDAGFAPSVTCEHEAAPLQPGERRRVLTGDHVRMSRRGFFRSLFSGGQQTDHQPLPAPDEPWIGEQSPKKRPRLPAWMAQAAAVYAERARPTAEPGAPWPAVQVSADCVECHACVDHCPTGALGSDVSAEDFAITFTPGQCVDCRICWASCPVGAITRCQEPTTAPFESRPVFQRQTTCCAHCGRPASAGHHTCYWCSQEPPLASVMTDARRWLFADQTL